MYLVWLFAFTTLVESIHLENEQRVVINGTLIIGLESSEHSVVFPRLDREPIITFSSAYRYDNAKVAIVVSGSNRIPETFIRCWLGCSGALFACHCDRVEPPACVSFKSPRRLTFNVTSSKWTKESVTFSEQFSTYSIVY